MKTLKVLCVGLLAAVGFAGTASATPTIIHVAGSTAFRAPATAAMLDYLGSLGGTLHAAYSGSSLLGAGSAILANGTIAADGSGTATVVIETYWTGSLAGVVDLVAQNNVGAFIDESNMGAGSITTFNASTVTTISSGGAYGGGSAITPSATLAAHVDVAFSDSVKSTIKSELATATLTGTIGAFSTISSLANAVGGSTVVNAGTGGGAAGAGLVGVVPFQWVAGNIASAGDIPTNMSQQNARSLISSGFLAESQFTGTNTAADIANYFYLTGRNEDSGTRIGAYMEGQFGVTAAPQQFSVTITGTTVTNAFLVAANSALNTEPAISWAPAGHSGYASGGNVATALDGLETVTPYSFSDGSQALGNTGASYFIGYLGVTDAATAVAGGAHALTYAGVPFTVANVQNGSYTFWTYEHVYRLSTLSGTALSAANAIADNVFLTDADIKSNGKHQVTDGGTSAGILYDANFNVSRTLTEGGAIIHN